MPLCSIIIPVYNWASLTRKCLNALLESPHETAAEVIVVDDASRDTTPQILAEFGDRIRAISHDGNAGYAASCNDGAAAATGEFLVFLNNDTLPHAGWLDALVWYAQAHPQAAVVGAKILNVDDTTQHAGVVVCQDRFTRSLYAGFPADHPAVNRSRRFQAVTGACMLVRRAAFEGVGGFDTGYRNAYEDHDLCLRLGELGHEVHYCHASVITHLESISRSRDSRVHAAATARYRQRWAHRLVPDDLAYYASDGLLSMTYHPDAPPTLFVSPHLAMLDEAGRAPKADQLLATRARQVVALQQRNARLAAELVEAQAARARLLGSRPDAEASVTPCVASPHTVVPSPPDDLVHLVGGDLAGAGAEFMEYFTSFCRLRPDEHVLDVGSGIGRMAVPLTRYLTPAARYRGFDITARSVQWCQEHITPAYSNFEFVHAPVFNRFYNPGSMLQAVAYRFPYDDASFDFVFLTSVFTHMLPDDLRHYAEEIARVLKPGGRCLISYFLLNDESVGLMQGGFSGPYVFQNASAAHSVIGHAVPEAAVAYREQHVRALYGEFGLRIESPIRYGRWCGRLDGLSLQDLVLAVKTAG